MEIKGLISTGESKSLTCCENIEDILIGGVSLYDELEKLFGQNAEEYFEAPYDEPKQSPKFSVRYVILDEVPLDDKSFAELSGEVITNRIWASHVSGCYSEWTCGYGGFGYAKGDGENGHSIFKELEGMEGKYIHFSI